MKVYAIPGVVPSLGFAAVVAAAVTPFPWSLAPMAVGLVAVWLLWKVIFRVTEIRAEDYLEFAKNLWRDAPGKAMEMRALGLRDKFEREKDFATAKRCEEDAEALRRGEIPPSMERE